MKGKLLQRIKFLLRTIAYAFLMPKSILYARQQFLMWEVIRLGKMLRNYMAENIMTSQDEASWDYQWENLQEGYALPGDPEFSPVKEILNCTKLPASWFSGKVIADCGCGIGRFTPAFAQLGAKQVDAFDKSPSAISETSKNTRGLCVRVFHWNALGVLQSWPIYDLVWCFGVVHHTGNTYRAIINVAGMVKPGGYLFLMVYGFPSDYRHFITCSYFEAMRDCMGIWDYDEKVRYINRHYGVNEVHGAFDAMSPSTNDLLTYSELHQLLTTLGFIEIERTRKHRNHFVIARKGSAS